MKNVFITVETTSPKRKAFTQFCKGKGMSVTGAIRVAILEKYGYDLAPLSTRGTEKS